MYLRFHHILITKLNLEKLPFSKDGLLDGVHILGGNPVHKVSAGLRGPELQCEDVILLLSQDGLAHHLLDGIKGHLLRPLFGPYQELVKLQLERETDPAPGLVKHSI